MAGLDGVDLGVVVASLRLVGVALGLDMVGVGLLGAVFGVVVVGLGGIIVGSTAPTTTRAQQLGNEANCGNSS